jgi:hypothetical protein
VLCQLSYAPRLVAANEDCTRGLRGIRSGMSDYEQQDGGDEREDDYALDKGNLDETEEAKEEDLDREREDDE